MQKLIAKSAASIDKCLRLLHAKKIDFKVEVCESDKGKVYYSVGVDLPEDEFESVKKEYELLVR